MGLFYTSPTSAQDTPASDLDGAPSHDTASGKGNITLDFGEPPPSGSAGRPSGRAHGSGLDRPQRTQPELSLARLGLAVGFLVLILVLGIVTSIHEIDPWDDVLVSTFQLLVGAVVGAIIGEKIGLAEP
ncbi:MAG: hypothetical protein R3362_11065 [Rhodothermales bacterium]|nr:hypothetical protein [Rhodothermales bacterium]